MKPITAFLLPAFRVSLVSGGSAKTTGVMAMDDFSIRVTPTGFATTGLKPDGGGWPVTWERAPGAVYAVESSPSLTPAAFADVPSLEAVQASDAATTTARDTRADAGTGRLCRVRKIQ